MTGQSVSTPGERLNVKWAAGVEEVELVEGASVGTLARLTVAGSVSSSTKRSSLGRSLTPASLQQFSGSGLVFNIYNDSQKSQITTSLVNVISGTMN